jgi:hypothetical protein
LKCEIVKRQEAGNGGKERERSKGKRSGLNFED